MGAASKDILKRVGDAVQRAADDIIVPAQERQYERLKREHPDSHTEGMKDPEYRKQDEKFNEYVKKHKQRKQDDIDEKDY